MIGRLKECIGQRSPLRLVYHSCKAFAAALAYGFPARNLTVIGVTGTDGKTTTSSMITHILRHVGMKTGMASTAFFDDGTGLRENPSHLTSINPFVLQKLLRIMVHNACTHAVLECSSHGLVQHRLDWTFPKIAAVTNTALEHLDYHGTMERYRKDKGKLFGMLRGRGTKVLNAGDATFEMYRNIPSEKTIVWEGDRGNQRRDAEDVLWLSDVLSSANSSEAKVHWRFAICDLRLNIPGTYNLENALCAISVCLALGIDMEKSAEALKTFSGIPGRLEPIDEGQPFSTYVDFAVSPQSYEKTLETLRSLVGESGRASPERSRRVMVMCSSCGNRMREKRPEIGRICSQLADVVIATEDETYGEDPHAVLEEVWSGVDRSQCEAHKIFDRREAIAFALKTAKSGDAVVFCGMGPFSTMTKLEGRIPWDERKMVREELKKLGYRS